MIFAQIEPDIHWPQTIQVMIGIVGLLAIIWLILSVAIACKKLFGKHPPLHQELASLRTEFENADLQLATSIAAERAAREKALGDLAIERRKTLNELNLKIDSMPSRIVADLVNAKNFFKP